MNEVSLLRLYVLRAMYVLMLVGLALTIWPLITNIPPNLERMRGVVWSVLTAVSLLAALGIRYPLQMLPLLFFELIWKSIWVFAIGLPAWHAGTLDEGMRSTLFDCALGLVLFPLVIPWGYAYTHYVKRPADRWKA